MSQQNEIAAGAPLISVVIPVWNRADTIRRCLDSICSQNFTDYEIVTVDDGSEDSSVAVIEEYDDPRVTVICHRSNRGSYAARATGFEHAKGRWFLEVDSDDALLPGAIATLAELISCVDDRVGAVGMSYRYDHGGVSPDPPFPSGDIDFPAWLKWTDRAKRLDFLTCFRREVFDDLAFPTDGRGAAQFMLRLASRWKVRVDERLGGMVYTNAANRLMDTKALILPKASLIAYGVMIEEVIREFGPQMRRHCPDRYTQQFLAAGRWYMLAGRRIKGAGYMIRYLLRKPNSLQGWAHLLLGVIGPRAIKSIISLRKARRASRRM